MISKALNSATGVLEELGSTFLFMLHSVGTFLREGVSFRQMVNQMYAVGVRSLSTTIFAGLFVGAIMAIEIHVQLRDFGAEGFLGGLATSVTIRNIGPVLIAFMLSAKVGAYTSAELATMVVTEQIDAIRCLGTNPISYIIVPRMIAVIICSFLLLTIGLMMSIGGGMVISNYFLHVSSQTYIQNIPRVVSWWSVGTGSVKSFVFGVLIATIACYQGYHAKGGAVGVGATVRRTAVQTLVCIIIADYMLSTISAFFYEWFRVGQL
ncbi:MAG: ABC transporter permease [Deltaproteobacteria bacterium]|nr:ABC transporter permease [Deltaproteobacteria bacterium]